MSRPRRAAASKVKALDELLRVLRPERAGGRTVVFTNGCYDLLHAGHLHLLESAAELGDLLVVGLNADGSVERLKGSGRPFIPFPERAALLGALQVVDWVVGFEEDTPLAVIQAILPDVLVKGADWAPESVVGRETVEARGGRVVSLPLVPARSTSVLVEKIRSVAPAGPAPEKP